MAGDRFAEISVGDRAEVRHTIQAANLDTFATLTGDNNPLHMDEDYASRTPMRQRVVHGMLTASFISTIIGTKLPGTGSLWFEQSLRFIAPARIGEAIVVTAEVLHKSPANRVLTLRTRVTGEGGRELVDGEAKVKVVESEHADEKKAESDTDRLDPVIVTGASRGIGAAIAGALARAGHPVIVNFRSSEADAERITRLIREDGGEAEAVRADVSDPDQVAAMFDRARAAIGEPLAIVNNASPAIDGKPLTDLAWHEIQRHLDVQVRGAFETSRAAVPAMIEAGRGRIVNITSLVADGVPPAQWTAYTMAKAALTSLTRSMAAELGPRGVRVNAVAPGMTMTDLIADLPERAKMVAKMQTPTRRLARPDDVASAVVYLLGDGADHVTGQTLRIGGGAVMG